MVVEEVELYMVARGGGREGVEVVARWGGVGGVERISAGARVVVHTRPPKSRRRDVEA